MEFINRISSSTDVDQLYTELTASLTGVFDLGILYVCPWNPYNPVEIYQRIKADVDVRNLLLCTAAGVIGSSQEIEGKPAVSLMLARLPQVSIDTFYLNQQNVEAINSPADWLKFFDIYPNEQPIFLCFPDPFSIDTNKILNGLNASYPGSPVVGGLVSAGAGPNENVLIVDGQEFSEGAIGLVLRGNIRVETVVSQGCRPIGESFIITKADRNIIYELAGKPFLEVLEQVLKDGTEFDRHLAIESVYIGIVIDEYKEKYGRGDFLIRGVLGVDADSGAGAIGDSIKSGQTIQFQVRDLNTASEDMHELFKLHVARKGNIKPHGALVFNCNGRGFNLFGEDNHDIGIIQHYVGPVPTAGLFCAGEIGPIGSKNFIHGFTNSAVFFYPK